MDRGVVNPDQIRTIIRTFKQKLPDIFPDRNEVPKTLIFAKTDSHADDIIQTVRDEFGEGNEFCKKITYKAEEDPKSVLASFRNGYNPRIAVTVDMIATGTDVKPLECLLFMRDVKSRNYFEQMKGRGTRTLDHDSLKKVTPSAKTAKTHYVIVDAVGVTRSLKTASQPLITKPSASIKDLLMGVMLGASDTDTITSLGGRLARLNQQLNNDDKNKFKQCAGVELSSLIGDLFAAVDVDNVEARAKELAGQSNNQITEQHIETAQAQLVSNVASILTGELVGLIDNIRKDKEQIIDHDNLDNVVFSGWTQDAQQNANEVCNEFIDYLETHKDEIDALSIFFNEPHRRREITYAMINELLTRLKTDKPRLSPLRVWKAYSLLDNYSGIDPSSQLTVLVALIRRVCRIDETLVNYEDTVRRNFQNWIMTHHAGNTEKFSPEQMAWLQMIRDHIASSIHIERDDLEMSPFDGKGGLAKMYQLFGSNMDNMFDELNQALAA